MTLEANTLAFQIHECPIIHSVSLSLKPGRCLAVIGPNGAGKTTLFRLLCGDLSPSAGSVRLNQQRLSHYSALELARVRAVLPQLSAVQFAVPVELIMRLSREMHATGREEDQSIIAASLARVDATHLLNREYTTLSGGERQRVQIARVLAQVGRSEQARYLFLDEPLNMLDIAHQHLCLHAFRQTAQDNVGVVMILHDINLALQYADEILVLDGGQVVAGGAPSEVISVDLLRRVFRVRASILQDLSGNAFVKVDGYI